MIGIIIYWALAYIVTLWIGNKFITTPAIKMVMGGMPVWIKITIGSYLAIWVSPFVLPWYTYWVFMNFVWRKIFPPTIIATPEPVAPLKDDYQAPEFVDFKEEGNE